MTDIAATGLPSATNRNETARYAGTDPHRSVRYWLYAVAAIVAVMVLVGGATRLTDSGLSITEWKPVTGVIPPLSAEDWAVEKDKYRTTTEYQTQNKGMPMAEFKVIYWWEWGHRFLGRLVGLVAVIPLVYFWMRNRLPSWSKPRLLLLVAMGGLQGFIGWWMVKSGLVNRVDVSQIRLAVHLTMACIIFAYTIWLARSLVAHSSGRLFASAWQGGALVILLLVQVFMGGLVAGLDAGMAYNTWPDMNGAMVPDGLFAMTPWWLNFTDNAMMVQFMHRITAYLLLAAVIAHAVVMMRREPSSPHARRAMLLVGLVTLQAALGIATLLMQVPMNWALAHQFGAVVILAVAVAHWHALKPRVAAGEIPALP
ncbi:COX15/CtaA family protein [Pseudahrensia aquimaris]|uniref:Heme A synthase n=1 Tax=Pseudahrensia aquimaris TaxID=744461 RepID=A0ABW3FBM9_9HYPH